MARKAKKARNEKGRLTRNQKKAIEKSFHRDDPEDLDAQLKHLGLSTKNITGDGNCLFRALSDQYYGHDGNHKAIRQEVCQFLRDNEEEYKFFVEDDQSFEHHVECMSQNATYGGNMELAAFAKMKEVNIKVYQPGMIYVINGKEEEEEEEESIQVLHIAYHSWEHYSSVRNIDGPYSGPPEIKVMKPGEYQQTNTGDEEEEDQEGLSSKEKVVLNACPGTNIRKVRRLLIKYKGDPDKVIDALYDSEQENPKTNDESIKSALETDELIKDKCDKQSENVDSTKDTNEKENLENENSKQNQDVKEDNDVKLDKNVELDQNKDQEKEREQDADKKLEEDTTLKEENPTCNIMPVTEAEPIEKETVQSEEIKTEQVETKIVESKVIEPVEKKPKKLSARERKEQSKRRQKEAKLEKERAKAARRNKYKQEKIEDPDNKSDTPTSKQNTTTMKEMHI